MPQDIIFNDFSFPFFFLDRQQSCRGSVVGGQCVSTYCTDTEYGIANPTPGGNGTVHCICIVRRIPGTQSRQKIYIMSTTHYISDEPAGDVGSYRKGSEDSYKHWEERSEDHVEHGALLTSIKRRYISARLSTM